MKKPEYAGRSHTVGRMRESFLEHLKQNLEEPNDQSFIVSLDDLIPKQVYRKLLENPNAKFRFKFVVEAEEV
jgi:hypothetical protein